MAGQAALALSGAALQQTQELGEVTFQVSAVQSQLCCLIASGFCHSRAKAVLPYPEPCHNEDHPGGGLRPPLAAALLLLWWSAQPGGAVLCSGCCTPPLKWPEHGQHPPWCPSAPWRSSAHGAPQQGTVSRVCPTLPQCFVQDSVAATQCAACWPG